MSESLKGRAQAIATKFMTFEELGLAKPLLKAIEKMGFQIPTPIQEAVIPLLLGERKDIMALAQTGSGKTAAFGLPIIQNITSDLKRPQALIIAPTRELCMQITRDMASYAIHMDDFSIVAVYGGASIEEQIQHIRRGTQVVVATPGRLLDLIRRGAIALNEIKDVVLDEADEMLNMGFIDDIKEILSHIPEERHLLLFSATMPVEVRSIVRKFMQAPTEVSVGNKQRINRNIQHIYYVVSANDRYLALKRIADYYPNIYGIIFCKTRRSTQEVATQLIADGYSADALHGELSQAQRDNVMGRFRNGTIQLLVATDVAARGLDVDNLSHVIHFGLPADVESYTHRSGRTARAGKKGISIAICHARERGHIRRIEKESGITIERATLPTAEMICEKQLLQLVHRMEHTVPDLEAIAPYMDSVVNRLSWLDSDDLIQRLIYLEIQRMLDYYKNAASVEEIPETEKKSPQKRKSSREEKVVTSEGMDLLQINVGKRNKLYPNKLIEMIEYCTGRKVPVGKITIFDRNATFEVARSEAEEVQEALNAFQYHKQPLRVTRHKCKRR